MKVENAEKAEGIIRTLQQCKAALKSANNYSPYAIVYTMDKVPVSLLPPNYLQTIREQLIEGLEERIVELEAELKEL